MPYEQGEEKYKRIIKTTENLKNEKRDSLVDEEMLKVVIFSLCDSLYAFYGDYTKSILPYDPITPVPGCPDYISGIINVRGDIESVISLHYFLGLAVRPVDGKTRIIIAETPELRSGILVNSVDDVIDIPLNSIAPPVATLDDRISSYVTGELEYHDTIVTVLDVKKIFGRINI